MTNVEYAKYKGVSAVWIGKLIALGKIKQSSLKFFPPKKRHKIIVEEADKDLKEYEDSTERREQQTNIDFDNPPQPISETIAGLTPEKKLEREKKEREEFDKIKELQKNLAENEDDNNVPDVDDSQAEWNKYWIMERALKTALERKKLEKTLIDVEEAKELIGKFLNPIVQDMDALAYDFKNYFPQADESMIDFLFNFIENVKKRSQRNVL